MVYIEKIFYLVAMALETVRPASGLAKVVYFRGDITQD
jgi:hypothetical protein